MLFPASTAKAVFMNSIQMVDFNVEELRARLRKMTDEELLKSREVYVLSRSEFWEAALGSVRGAIEGVVGRNGRGGIRRIPSLASFIRDRCDQLHS
jgi:hypothetical protein